MSAKIVVDCFDLKERNKVANRFPSIFLQVADSSLWLLMFGRASNHVQQSRIGAKVTANDTVPSWIVLLVKLLTASGLRQQ